MCEREKARTQVYPLQVTDILARPFDKIAIDWVSDLNVSKSGNQHILTITDHLTGCSVAFTIPDKKADTIVHVFINNYLPIYMCPHFILSDSGTEFKNQLMKNIHKQLANDHIFSVLYHPQSNGKLEVFHKYFKPTLRKLWKWSRQLGQIHQPSISQLPYDTTPSNCWSILLHSLWKRSQSTPPTPIAGIHPEIPGWSWIWTSRHQITPPCTCHSQEDFGWEQI